MEESIRAALVVIVMFLVAMKFGFTLGRATVITRAIISGTIFESIFEMFVSKRFTRTSAHNIYIILNENLENNGCYIFPFSMKLKMTLLITEKINTITITFIISLLSGITNPFSGFPTL
jgi:hypothetical protein